MSIIALPKYVYTNQSQKSKYITYELKYSKPIKCCSVAEIQNRKQLRMSPLVSLSRCKIHLTKNYIYSTPPSNTYPHDLNLGDCILRIVRARVRCALNAPRWLSLEQREHCVWESLEHHQCDVEDSLPIHTHQPRNSTTSAISHIRFEQTNQINWIAKLVDLCARRIEYIFLRAEWVIDFDFVV